jgi:hypothetical protein
MDGEEIGRMCRKKGWMTKKMCTSLIGVYQVDDAEFNKRNHD